MFENVFEYKDETGKVFTRVSQSKYATVEDANQPKNKTLPGKWKFKLTQEVKPKKQRP